MAEKISFKEKLSEVAKACGIDEIFTRHAGSTNAYLVHFFHVGKWRVHDLPAEASRRWSRDHIRMWLEVACTVARDSHYFDGIWDFSEKLREKLGDGDFQSYKKYVLQRCEEAGHPLKEAQRYSAWHYLHVPMFEVEYLMDCACDKVRDELARPEPIQVPAIPPGAQVDYNEEHARLEAMVGVNSVSRGEGGRTLHRHSPHESPPGQPTDRVAEKCPKLVKALNETKSIPTCICGAKITGETHTDYCPCSDG